ncbi:MAG: hypothetical protein HYZ50_20020 [Deltaproteobacteria bacterium]|nr:hypothetical protein [Deltaproteobacteria bacterium]
MLPSFDATGKLPPGIYWATWREVRSVFGFTPRRVQLLTGLRQALVLLKRAGCRSAYIDGSFVTRKLEPADIDVCWAIEHVDPDKLDPVFLDFSRSRAAQKARFLCEFFPADLPEGLTGKTFLEFFQTDKETGAAKGIVALDLRRWQP